MPLISDKFQKEKLEKYNINIKTKYIDENKILERNSDNSTNDNINNGIRIEKQYFINNKLEHSEKDFDSRIEYKFISNIKSEEEYTCPNCGVHCKLSEFSNGCPYCGTYYNIDYTEKSLANKYHYDRIIRSNKYRIVTAIIDIIISILLSFIFIKNTSRTFNSYDITKIFIYGVILSLILYYLFYIIDGYIILEPIKKYKDKQNKKQIEFWNRTKIDKNKFFNNLNYEIRNKYYSNSDIIDYDIIDYDEFIDKTIDNILNVEVKAYVRVVTIENRKIKSKYITDTYKLRRVNKNLLDLKDGANIIKCINCGASIDATKGKCEYCGIEINPLQEWEMY